MLAKPGERQAKMRAAVWAAARASDHDRYLAALLSPAEVRDDLIALAAFAGEIARIPLLVSEPMMGEIRLQWWRDALPGLSRGEPTGNPVADAFGAAVRRHALPIGLILGVLDARAFELYPDPMPDEQTFKAYLAKTEGALFDLAWRVVSGSPPGTASAVVAAAGQVVGCARALANLPVLLAKGRCVLPATRLQACGNGVADLAAVPMGPAARQLITTLCRDMRVMLTNLGADWRARSRRQRTVFLPVALVEPQLRAFDSLSHHPGRDVVQVLPLTRVWRIWRAHVTGRI